jgi:hypothetical protein
MAINPAAMPALGSTPAPTLEIAGPRAENLVDAAVKLAAKRGVPLRVESVSNSADPDQALYESGGLLPGPNAKLAGPTFEQWLASATYGQDRSAA